MQKYRVCIATYHDCEAETEEEAEQKAIDWLIATYEGGSPLVDIFGFSAEKEVD